MLIFAYIFKELNLSYIKPFYFLFSVFISTLIFTFILFLFPTFFFKLILNFVLFLASLGIKLLYLLGIFLFLSWGRPPLLTTSLWELLLLCYIEFGMPYFCFNLSLGKFWFLLWVLWWPLCYSVTSCLISTYLWIFLFFSFDWFLFSYYFDIWEDIWYYLKIFEFFWDLFCELICILLGEFSICHWKECVFCYF